MRVLLGRYIPLDHQQAPKALPRISTPRRNTSGAKHTFFERTPLNQTALCRCSSVNRRRKHNRYTDLTLLRVIFVHRTHTAKTQSSDNRVDTEKRFLLASPQTFGDRKVVTVGHDGERSSQVGTERTPKIQDPKKHSRDGVMSSS